MLSYGLVKPLCPQKRKKNLDHLQILAPVAYLNRVLSMPVQTKCGQSS